MESRLYKEQFLEFLTLMYPHGISLGINTVSLTTTSGAQYMFVFDPTDYREPVKPAETFTSSDKQFLKAMNIEA